MTPESLPPRVMHLRSSCGFYGAEGVIHTLVHAYSGESVVCCLADAREPHSELCDRLSTEGYPSVSIPTRGAVDPRVLLRFAFAIRRFRPNVVHCHDYKSAVIAAVVGRPMRLGLIFTVHGDLRATVGAAALIRLGHWALRRFDGVVGVSDATASDAREYGVAERRIRLVQNGVDTTRFRPSEARTAARAALDVPEDGVLIGVVGRFSEEKGHAVLLQAVGKLDAPWRLALIGDGPLESDLRAQASAMGITDRTHFLGRREDIECVYHALDVLALPSHREGLPLAVVEAGACGLPVAATNVGDVARVVLDGETGFLSPAGDPAALSRSLARLCSDGCLRAKLGAAARCHVEKSFSAPAMAAGYERLYREAARK